MHNKSHVSKGTVGYHCNHKPDENPISISHGTRTAIHTNSTQTNRHHSTMNFHEHPSQITAVDSPNNQINIAQPELTAISIFGKLGVDDQNWHWSNRPV